MDPVDPRTGNQPAPSEGTAPWTPRPGEPDPFGEPAGRDEPPPRADGLPAEEANQSAPDHHFGDDGSPAPPAQLSGDPDPSQLPPHQQPAAGDHAEQVPARRGLTKRTMQVIAAVVVAAAAFLVLGLWKPGFLNTTKLDLTIAQRNIEQLLSDRTNGYGLTGVADVKCNNGENPTVRPGATFTCTVSIGGSPHQVTVTFDNSAGDYTVSLPQ